MNRVRMPAFDIDVFYSLGCVLCLSQLPVPELKPYGLIVENSTLSFLGIGEDSEKPESFKQTVGIARSGILPAAARLPTRQPGSFQGSSLRDGRCCLPPDFR